jgi:hypothetical protein
MNPKIFQFTFRELNISKKEVVNSILGGKENESSQYYIDILDQVFLQITDYSGIKGGYIETDDIAFDAKTKEVKVLSHEFKVGNIVFNELKRSAKIIVFTCTAGKQICDYVKEEYKTDALKGFLIESLANVIVETAMDKIMDKMREENKTHNYLISNRFSPGYCTWDVVEQHKLFSLLPKDFCGVSLTESALMHPIKSISGFIGVGENIKYNHYKCKFCTQKQCIYKRKLQEV